MNIGIWVIGTLNQLFIRRSYTEINLTPFLFPYAFPKNVSSKESVKPWFFVTFNIIIFY